GFCRHHHRSEFQSLGCRRLDSLGGRGRRHHHILGWRALPRRQDDSRLRRRARSRRSHKAAEKRELNAVNSKQCGVLKSISPQFAFVPAQRNRATQVTFYYRRVSKHPRRNACPCATTSTMLRSRLIPAPCTTN